MTDIAFIGGGNMARALLGGLIGAGTRADSLRVSDPSEPQRHAVQALGVETVTADNAVAARGADTLVLAVKPQYLRVACGQIADIVSREKQLVISIAAGIPVASLSDWLGGHERIVRVMPNTPALVGRGASGMFAQAAVSAADRSATEAILAAVGVQVWVDEEAGLDRVTALSGSGPAYFFFLMECMENAARAQGMDAGSAALLCRQTAAGAAAMALAGDADPAELRRQVSSPGGTTEAAIRALVEHDFENAIAAAMTAAQKRSIELASLTQSD